MSSTESSTPGSAASAKAPRGKRRSSPPPSGTIARHVLAGFGTGVLLALSSAVMPSHISPRFHIETSVLIMLVVGLGLMGAFFGYLRAVADS